MTFRGIAYGLLFFLITVVAFGQPATLPEKKVVFSRLPENLGLSQSSINAILQDREGFLWFATWSGLIRYDGYTTRVFHSGNKEFDLKGNLISTLFEDHNGDLWIGTHVTGLFQFNKKTNQFINHRHSSSDPSSLSNNNIWDIIEDENHNLWIATEGGVNFFDRKTNTFRSFVNDVRDQESLSDNFVTDIFIASDKSIWVATNFGLNRLHTNAQGKIAFERFFNPDTENADNFVYQVAEIKKGNQNEIWFITKKGLKYLDGKKIVNYTAAGKPSNYSMFRCLMQLNSNEPYLVLGSAVGISFFNAADRTFEKHISNLDGILPKEGHSMAVTSIYLDRGGVLWVGTKKGLYKSDSYKQDIDLFLTSSFDLTNSIITGIRTSSKGYWISTIGGGIFHYDRNRFQSFPLQLKEKGDFAPFVQSLFTDSYGRVWVGTAGAGVMVFESEEALRTGKVGNFRHYHMGSDPYIKDDYIVSFAEDNTGNIWIGTWDGSLIRISSKGEIDQYDREQFGKAPIVTMHADNSGTLWVGTRGNGIFRTRIRNREIDLKHFSFDRNNAESIPNNFINAIYEDHAGSLWIATEGGLTLFNRRTENFTPYEIKEGPANKVIVGILEDDDGKLWLSHWNGITVIDPKDTLQNTVRNFDTHDFIQGGFFYNNVCMKDSDGQLLFGGSNGFNIIQPKNLFTNPVVPKVVISEFRLFNQPVAMNEDVNNRILFSQPLNNTREIVLKYFENTLSFEFAALDFAAPEKLRYAYRLKGFDEKWNYTSSERRFANYTNLNDGVYTFMVKSTNNDGVWNSPVTEMTVTVLPPWWRTTWAFLSYVIFTIGMLYLFRKLILMRVNFIHDLKLERIQRENMEKLNRAKLQFFTNISHEFRTPLTLILGPVQNLMESVRGDAFMRNQLFTINNNAQRLLRLVNQLLDFRKAESGNLKLQVSEGNIVKFVKEIKLSFDALAEQMKIDFRLISSSNIIKIYFDRDQFEKILFNLLSNAFKHTPEGGSISIEIMEKQQGVAISVSDNGRGIKPEVFEHLFQTFFSYDDDRHHSGTGIGLALVKTLVDAHHGEIEVQSEENQFTRFTITLKSGSSHFDAAEMTPEKSDYENIAVYPVLGPEVLMVPEKEEVSQPLEDLPRILIVEDNAEVRAYVKSVFAGTYLVLEAEDGKEGLQVALEEIPDIIISDVMMPYVDGISLCKQLKSDPKTSHIPVILLTARTSLIFKVEGLETGADDYVTKPFNPRVLQLKVKNLLKTLEQTRKLFKDNEVLKIEPNRVTLNSADEKFVSQVLESIEKNMSTSEYSVEVLCDDVGMSRMQLYRKLKALTGLSANEFIRSIRLKRAAQLLEQNQLTVAEITYEVGFSDLQYFRECFKKMFAVTPTEYAQRFIRNEAGKGK